MNELARLGKLGDGSARRDVVVPPGTGFETLAVGLAVARLIIVEVDGHERLAVFSLTHVPALTDALRVTHELVQLGIAPAALRAPILIFDRAARVARLPAGLVRPDSIIALAIDAALDDLVGLASDMVATLLALVARIVQPIVVVAATSLGCRLVRGSVSCRLHGRRVATRAARLRAGLVE